MRPFHLLDGIEYGFAVIDLISAQILGTFDYRHQAECFAATLEGEGESVSVVRFSLKRGDAA